MTEVESEIVKVLEGVARAAMSRMAAAMLAPSSVEAAMLAHASAPITSSRVEAMREAIMAAVAESQYLSPMIANVPTVDDVKAAMVASTPRGPRGQRVGRQDCPNCGTTGYAFDGGPCPVCGGEGSLPVY